MTQTSNIVQAIEINASMIGALFTDRSDNQLRIFCFYFNGDTGEFDVPEESNRDSLHSLFAKLDMVDKCTNVILEKVVRGRIYVEREGGLFSYTLLAALGDVHPLLDTNTCNLPWETVWASSEAEVLRVAGVGQAKHCYAIRSPVKEVDVAALYRTSRAFVNPKPVVKKITGVHSNAVRQGVIVALLVIVVGLSWLMGYSMGNNAPALPATMPELEAASSAVETKVHMIFAQAITGPYTMTELSRMNAAGKLPAEAMFRVVGNSEWKHFVQLSPLSATTSGTR